MVTREMLVRLRAEQRTPNQRMEYNIDGDIHTRVVSCTNAELNKRILRGEQTLQDMLGEFRHEQAFKSRQGLAKAQFNHSNEEPRL
jgi:hypothetical protein